jgi:hypothetical protein
LHATQCTDAAGRGVVARLELLELLDDPVDALDALEALDAVDPADGLAGAVAAGFEEEPPQAAATSITTTAPASAPLIRRSLGMRSEITGVLRAVRFSNG